MIHYYSSNVVRNHTTNIERSNGNNISDIPSRESNCFITSMAATDGADIDMLCFYNSVLGVSVGAQQAMNCRLCIQRMMMAVRRTAESSMRWQMALRFLNNFGASSA